MVGSCADEFLRVPPRSSVSFFAEVPPNASLWLGRVTSERTAAEDACALEVGIETESGSRSIRFIRPGDSGLEPIRARISSDNGEIAGIRFTARAAEGNADCRAALNIVEPHVVAAPTQGVALDPGGGDLGRNRKHLGRRTVGRAVGGQRAVSAHRDGNDFRRRGVQYAG